MTLIPPFFLDCVVAIGVQDQDTHERSWIASGFLYGHLVPEADPQKRGYMVYLVTNRHVVEEMTTIFVRFNPKTNEPAKEYEFNLSPQSGILPWFGHPNKEIDIAVIPINFQALQDEGIQAYFFANDQHSATIDQLNERGVTEGDTAYVLGFPMGLVGGQRNFVIVRGGIIARMRDTLAKANQEYLIDAPIFPGNSGGPVISKPEIVSIVGTKSSNAAYLIGIVKAYVPYRDVAISVQTKRPRVVFEENSGLAAVHPIDFVNETIVQHTDSLKSNVEKKELAQASFSAST